MLAARVAVCPTCWKGARRHSSWLLLCVLSGAVLTVRQIAPLRHGTSLNSQAEDFKPSNAHLTSTLSGPGAKQAGDGFSVTLI